jgi:hypothetical protein
VCTRAEAKERTRDRVVLKKDKEQGREEQREKANNNKASKQKNEKEICNDKKNNRVVHFCLYMVE